MNHWLLIPAVCGITLNAAVDFTGPGFPPLSLNRAEERGQGASSGKGGLLVKWDAARHPYWEWSFTPPLTLPEFDSAEFRVGLRVTGPDAVRRFNLRLADATGEVFQYEQMPLWPAGGDFTLDYRIDAAKGADRVEVAGGVMRIIPPPVAVPGRTLPLEIELISPASRPIEAELTLLLPAGLQAESDRAELTLKPGEKCVWKTQLSVGGDFQPKLGEAETVMVECRIPALGYRDRLEQPVVGALPLPARFDLNRKNQTVSLFDADPTKTALVWSGPGDLSAEVRLDASDRELLLRVDVTDDRHCQPFWGSDMWQGDGVQFALAVPGQQGLWELGLSLSDSGGSECFAWSVPNGFDRTAAAAAMRLEAERRGTVTHYRAAIPLAALGLDRTKLREGIRFNLLVNDNDGEARKGWIAAAPGIGSGKDAGKYPVVVGP